MNWHATPATMDDVKALLEKASEITRQDLEGMGYTLEDAAEGCRVMLEGGEAMACWVGDELHGVFGVYLALPEPPPVYETWSLWSDDVFGKLSVPAALAMRSVLKKLRSELPDAVIASTSYSRHPDVTRWFKALGFELVREDEGSRVFSYRRA